MVQAVWLSLKAESLEDQSCDFGEVIVVTGWKLPGESGSALGFYQGAILPASSTVTGPGLPMGVGRGRREGARSPPSPPCTTFGLWVHRPNCQSTCKHILQWLACGMGLIITKISHLLCFLASFFPLFEAPVLMLMVCLLPAVKCIVLLFEVCTNLFSHFHIMPSRENQTL